MRGIPLFVGLGPALIYFRRSERRGLSDRAHRRHEALLQIGLGDGHPPLVRARHRLERLDQDADLFGLRLDRVHRVDLILRKIPIAFDLFVLVVHRHPCLIEVAGRPSPRKPRVAGG